MSVAAHRFDNDLRYRDADHPDQTQFTPEYILEPIRHALGGIQLDPCTTPDNPVGAERFYCPPVNGLVEPWDAETIFVNPPYGRIREPWVQRCVHAGGERRRVVLLIPAATDTRTFQRAVALATSLVFVAGRVKFGTLRPNRRQQAASHPSALIGWNVDLDSCRSLGVVLRLQTGSP